LSKSVEGDNLSLVNAVIQRMSVYQFGLERKAGLGAK
jgi:hypothetical protein